MDIFISYANANNREARLLKELLKGHGFDVFYAEDSLRVSDDWRLLIKEAARRCAVVVVLSSSASRISAWVQQEAGIAMASGAAVIPVVLEGSPSDLPGWLSDFQAVTVDGFMGFRVQAEKIAMAIIEKAALQTAQVPQELRVPKTVGAFVLRVLRHDQFAAPIERMGAWSRQYDRYLALYYGSAPPATVSQGVSLTFTGMNISRLREFLTTTSDEHRAHATSLMERTIHFLRTTQDPDEGGFGRRVDALKSRGGRGLELDLRHTCWGLSAMLDIDSELFQREVILGYNWLLSRLAQDLEKDRWCWTSAAVSKALLDPRCPVPLSDRELGISLAISALETAWDPSHCSWVAEEPIDLQRRISVDNALYVLECIAPYRSISPALEYQCEKALTALLSKCISISARRGLPFFDSTNPEPGPSAQLIRIMNQMNRTGTSDLIEFVVKAISNDETLPLTFSWHLSAALAVPELIQRPI